MPIQARYWDVWDKNGENGNCLHLYPSHHHHVACPVNNAFQRATYMPADFVLDDRQLPNIC